MSKIIVLFEVKPTKTGLNRYLELASQLKPGLSDFEGFLRAERFQSLTDDGKLLSMNIWDSEEAVANWRNDVEHRIAQLEGREKLFDSYKITVSSVIREYSDSDRREAP